MGTTVTPNYAVLELAEGVEQRETYYLTHDDAVSEAVRFAHMGYDCEVYRFDRRGASRMVGVVRRYSDGITA